MACGISGLAFALRRLIIKVVRVLHCKYIYSVLESVETPSTLLFFLKQINS